MQSKTTEIKIDGIELDVEHSAILATEHALKADIDIYSVKINNQEVPLDWLKRDFKNDMIVQIRIHVAKERNSNEEYKFEMLGEEMRGN